MGFDGVGIGSPKFRKRKEERGQTQLYAVLIGDTQQHSLTPCGYTKADADVAYLFRDMIFPL